MPLMPALPWLKIRFPLLAISPNKELREQHKLILDTAERVVAGSRRLRKCYESIFFCCITIFASSEGIRNLKYNLNQETTMPLNKQESIALFGA